MTALTKGFGSALIYDAAEGLERALADVDADALTDIDGRKLIALWDPFSCPTENLTALAFAMGVNLWEDEWSETTKRQWLADQWQFKALRGTEAAIRMALEVNGFELKAIVKPPEGVYTSPGLTKDEQDAWVRRMPQLKLYTAPDVGTVGVDEWFVGVSHLGADCIGLDDGWTLRGHKAVLRRDGVDEQLKVVTRVDEDVDGTAMTITSVVEPGISSLGFVIGADAIGSEHYIGVDDVPARRITTRQDQSYSHRWSHLSLSMLEPTGQPVDVRFDRGSDVGDGGPFFFIGEDVVGERHLSIDPARQMIFDFIYLLDPAISTVMHEGAGFIGVDRIGMRRNRAELLIDLKMTDRTSPGLYIGDGYLGEAFAIPEDQRQIERALRAVDAARGFKQQVLVSFASVEPLTFGDPINEDTTFGTWQPALL
jgi:phage tail P2-like protein